MIDHGIGMTDDELAEANRVLSEPSMLDMTPSRVLGHYVVSKLASRHAVTVRLSKSQAGSGVTATIELPNALIVDDVSNGRYVAPSMPVTQPIPAVQPDTQAPYGQHAPVAYEAVTPVTPSEPVAHAETQNQHVSNSETPAGSTSGGIGAGGLVQRVKPGGQPQQPEPPVAPPTIAPVSPGGLPLRQRTPQPDDPPFFDPWAETPATLDSFGMPPLTEADLPRSSLEAFQAAVQGQGIEPISVTPPTPTSPLTGLPGSSGWTTQAGIDLPHAGGLPMRQPGQSMAADVPALSPDQLSAPDVDPSVVRQSLAAFQSGTQTAHDAPAPADLAPADLAPADPMPVDLVPVEPMPATSPTRSSLRRCRSSCRRRNLLPARLKHRQAPFSTPECPYGNQARPGRLPTTPTPSATTTDLRPTFGRRSRPSRPQPAKGPKTDASDLLR